MIKASNLDLNKLETGDVLLHNNYSYFYDPRTWLSWVIRKITNSPYNHASEVLVLNDGEPYFIESLLSGVTLTKCTDWVQRYGNKTDVLVLRYVHQDQFDLDEYRIRGLMELDKKYDVIGLVRDMLLYAVFGYWREKTDTQSKRAWRCSEFNAYMKNLKGRQKFMPKDFATHKDFYDVQDLDKK